MYDYLRVRLNKLAGQLSYLPRTVTLVWAAAPRYTVMWAALLIVQGLFPLQHGDDEAVRQAAAFAGAEDKIRGLPQALQTHLGKQFSEGVELSAGEWQRIAIARAFFRQAPIILLDEPTSAMDPWTEIAWVEQMRRFAAGRIAVVVTHRFTTAMFADVI